MSTNVLNKIFEGKIKLKDEIKSAVYSNSGLKIYTYDCTKNVYNDVLSRKINPSLWTLFHKEEGGFSITSFSLESFNSREKFSIKPSPLAPSEYYEFMKGFEMLHKFVDLVGVTCIEGSNISISTLDVEFYLPMECYSLTFVEEANTLTIDGTKLHEIITFWRFTFPRIKPEGSFKCALVKLYLEHTFKCKSQFQNGNRSFVRIHRVHLKDFRIRAIRKFIEIKGEDVKTGLITLNVINSKAYTTLYAMNIKLLNLVGYILSKKFEGLDVLLIEHLLTFVEL